MKRKLGFTKADTSAVVVSTYYDRALKQQLVKARYVGLESGSVYEIRYFLQL